MRLRPPQLLELSPSDRQALVQQRAHVEAWGWQLTDPEPGDVADPVLTHAAVVLGTPLNATELQVLMCPLPNDVCALCAMHCS